MEVNDECIFGFMLYLIINDKGEIISNYLTKSNVDDRDAKTVTQLKRHFR